MLVQAGRRPAHASGGPGGNAIEGVRGHVGEGFRNPAHHAGGNPGGGEST